MIDLYFKCERRDMLVAKDTTDCTGCGMRQYPTPCKQFAEWHQKMKRGELGYQPEIFLDTMGKADITE